jgi:hypothetical protein
MWEYPYTWKIHEMITLLGAIPFGIFYSISFLKNEKKKFSKPLKSFQGQWMAYNQQ